MCGFAGALTIPGSIDVSNWQRADAYLKRRGPDSLKLWKSSDGAAWLYHARLSIVDFDSRAHQPLANEKLKITVALVGEIYNYEEVRSLCSGYPFQTSSDTEVILAVYHCCGIAGFSKLKGMFAFALVDENNKKMILTRDSIGKKPLFIYQAHAGIFFGTSILPLAKVSGLAPEIDSGQQDFFWSYGHSHPFESLIKNAKPVNPGEVIVFNWDRTLAEIHYLDIAPALTYDKENDAEIDARVRALLQQALRRRLHNNPKPTVLLSGGIDSTVIVQEIKKLTAESPCVGELQALSLRPLIPMTQDEPYARYAAWRLKQKTTFVSLELKQLSEKIERAFSLQDEPLAMPSYFYLTELVNTMAKHSRILITGDGGDEVFLGYGKIQDWFADCAEDTRNAAKGDLAKGIYGNLPSWMSPWAKFTVRESLLGHMMTKADRASAEQGVELRSPLLDIDLVSYVRSIPEERLRIAKSTKPLLKALLATWPGWFIEREKIGFAFNLRWMWRLSGFRGVREWVSGQTISAFHEKMPQPLQKSPELWSDADIFNHFGDVWKILTWSFFVSRLKEARL